MTTDVIDERLNSLRHMEYDITVQQEIEKLELMKDNIKLREENTELRRQLLCYADLNQNQ